jgi:hypothetical protein
MHEDLRSGLIGVSPGDQGVLWLRNRAMALALAATMPCGSLRFQSIRSRLAPFIALGEHLSSVPLLSTLPSVVPVSTLSRPWPSSVVYVGHGPIGSDLNASPWGSPFLDAHCGTCSQHDYRSYAMRRADREWWLAPLVNKTLVCHCSASENCHAHTLACIIVETFRHAPSHPPTPVDDFGPDDAAAGIIPHDNMVPADISKSFLGNDG